MANEKKETKRTEERKIKLPCKLTQEERIETGGALAAVVISISNHETELAEANDEFKALKKDIEQAITGFKVRISELSKMLSTGIEEREVECLATFDYEAGTVTVRRTDTDEVIEDREMKGLENQMEGARFQHRRGLRELHGPGVRRYGLGRSGLPALRTDSGRSLRQRR